MPVATQTGLQAAESRSRLEKLQSQCKRESVPEFLPLALNICSEVIFFCLLLFERWDKMRKQFSSNYPEIPEWGKLTERLDKIYRVRERNKKCLHWHFPCPLLICWKTGSIITHVVSTFSTCSVSDWFFLRYRYQKYKKTVFSGL